MAQYIEFTPEQKERAASVDLEEFLLRQGEKLIKSGREKRLASDHSVTVNGCEWFDHASNEGGRAVSFVQILAPELTDKMLAEFLEMDCNLLVNLHIQSIDQMKAIKLVKAKVTDINRMKIEEQARPAGRE